MGRVTYLLLLFGDEFLPQYVIVHFSLLETNPQKCLLCSVVAKTQNKATIRLFFSRSHTVSYPRHQNFDLGILTINGNFYRKNWKNDRAFRSILFPVLVTTPCSSQP